jgi:hypothetical protein
MCWGSRAVLLGAGVYAHCTPNCLDGQVVGGLMIIVVEVA